MYPDNNRDPALVSVVIPCYNHAKYLPVAIQSVLEQDYSSKEIIVVNDGSVDDTETVAKSFSQVKYVYQSNAGLACARNTGMEHAAGDYIVFLDADDILLPGALRHQAEILDGQPEVAFVAGGHVTANENLEDRKEVSSNVNERHYENLLQRNYIGMHAAVMYRGSVIREMGFDTKLKACEDYDLYLRVAFGNPVANHKKPIAVYRSHSNNMSTNTRMMLEQALLVLEKQKPLLKTEEQLKAYRTGVKNWIDFYSYLSYGQLKNAGAADKQFIRESLRLLWTYKPRLYIRHYLRKLLSLSKRS